MSRPKKPRPRPAVDSGASLLAKWRRGLRFSQEEAAVFLRVSRQNYCRWESGDREPEFARWFMIHEATRGEVPWWSWTTASVAQMIKSVVLGAAAPAVADVPREEQSAP